MPKTRNLFPYCTPSRRVTRRRYPEAWAWWAASDWQMLVEDTEDGGLRLHTVREMGARTSLWGGMIGPEEASTPEGVRAFLVEALYLHLHPRKAHKLLGAVGQVCTEAELAAFTRAQRRKVGKLTP
jgi:hypothetical protein